MDWEAQASALSRQVDRLASMQVVLLVLYGLLLVCMVAALTLLVRLRRRNRKVESWLEREMRALRDAQPISTYVHVLGQQQAVHGNHYREPPQQPQRTAPPQRQPAQEVYVEPVPEMPPKESPAPPVYTTAPEDVTALINEMLAGNQPYNFVESLRALVPQLTLQRLMPVAHQDVFQNETLLEQGGDGLFALINGDRAQLYPNYSRFSATLDPKPLYDGARHGARIHSVLMPAVLEKQDSGTWVLREKGRVQMRQSM